MNILFLTPRLPLPADTGAKIRTFNLLKNAAKDNRVSLLCFYFQPNDKGIEELEKSGISVHLVKTTEKIAPSKIFGRLPLSIEKYRSPEAIDKLRELIRSDTFELVHFDHAHMGQYVEMVKKEAGRKIVTVLDEHNVETLILKRCAQIERNPLKKFLFRSQANKMAGFEGKLAVKFSKCLTVSEDDKNALFELSGAKADIEVIPNGVDTDYFMPTGRSQESREDSLVFTGSMDWLPNTDAVLYFCGKILPLIRKKKPDVKFYIVGKNPADSVKRLSEKDERTIVTGLVDDVRHYIAGAKVFVAPLRIGGGTRLKILEAMAMGKTVVSTAIGAEGIKYNPGANIVIKNNPEEFAAAVVSLINDEPEREAIGSAARDLAVNNYSWQIIGKRLTDTYKGISLL